MKRARLAWIIVPLLATQIGATDCGEVLRDPGFDLWCGANLCAWKVERGTIARVATWHEGDEGVELGDGAAITQLSPVTSKDGTCISFTMIADVAADAEVHLEMDVFGDGTVEHDERVPTSAWAPVSFLVAVADPYQAIEFRLTKTGPGRAVLADIQAKIAKGCPGAPVPVAPRANGAWCKQAGDCASGRCDAAPFWPADTKVCGTCTTDADCTGGLVCGVEDHVRNVLAPYRACVPAAARELGELCVENAECATGLCTLHSCSTCAGAGGSSCTGGASCQAVADQPYWFSPPSRCRPAAAGAVCLEDSDCTSKHCAGQAPLRVCEVDGRSCTVDTDCTPADLIHPGHCLTVGSIGGICQ